jgi:hypothetical protein
MIEGVFEGEHGRLGTANEFGDFGVQLLEPVRE